jgi:hypothetical protein
MEEFEKLAFAKKILEKDFIGFDELKKILGHINFDLINIPNLTLDENQIIKAKKENKILLLVHPFLVNNIKLSIKYFRDKFGVGLNNTEYPTFYNQDWYLKESFFLEEFCKSQWVLIDKNLKSTSRGIVPKSENQQILGRAFHYTYTFFIYFLLNNGEILWENDYIWCNDYDHNGDMIYVGRYSDPNSYNNKGFSIHRHLTVSSIYGCVNFNSI